MNIHTVTFRKKPNGKGIEVDTLSRIPLAYFRNKLDRDHYREFGIGLLIPKQLWLALAKHEHNKYVAEHPLG